MSDPSDMPDVRTWLVPVKRMSLEQINEMYPPAPPQDTFTTFRRVRVQMITAEQMAATAKFWKETNDE